MYRRHWLSLPRWWWWWSLGTIHDISEACAQLSSLKLSFAHIESGFSTGHFGYRLCKLAVKRTEKRAVVQNVCILFTLVCEPSELQYIAYETKHRLVSEKVIHEIFVDSKTKFSDQGKQTAWNLYYWQKKMQDIFDVTNMLSVELEASLSDRQNQINLTKGWKETAEFFDEIQRMHTNWVWKYNSHSRTYSVGLIQLDCARQNSTRTGEIPSDKYPKWFGSVIFSLIMQMEWPWLRNLVSIAKQHCGLMWRKT